MKKTLLTLFAIALSISAFANSDLVRIDSRDITLLLNARKGSTLNYLYFGPTLNRIEDATSGSVAGVMNHDVDEQHAGAAGINFLPVYGSGQCQEWALAVTHTDGNMSLVLGIEDVTVTKDGTATETRVKMKDPAYPFWVTACFRSYSDVSMIETWTEIEHQEKKGISKTVTLRRFDSVALPIRRGDVWCTHFYGTWANEERMVEEKLYPGVLTIENKDGVRNSHTAHSEVMFSLDGKPCENSGSVIGAALIYTGNYELRASTTDTDYHTFYAGICPDNAEYPLKAKEVFKTPAVALTFSLEGKSGVSRNFHRWSRAHLLVHGDKTRNVLLNSWEGVYFDITEPKMEQMMKDIKYMGGELFVMDDGWFGEKYPRFLDTTSLGDWKVYPGKLPHGIPWLVDKAKENDLKFGIWIEPEMLNTVSELYEKHPDWVINAPGRDLSKGRGGTQMVLDMGNPAVQDFVFGVVDDLMTENPDLAYIKWDANMNIRSHGAQNLKPEEYSTLHIRYHEGLEKVMQRIRAKYPDLVIQTCASGGGRANFAYLRYFDEFWCSDNTDALQRVYMQWGTSHFFPASTFGCHISASPNHQTYRLVPLKFRIDVAMAGRLGMEIQPRNMTEAERDLCRKAINEYKEVRETVQLGDIYRLVSPYDGLSVASMMYVEPDKTKAVFYWWKTEYFYDQHCPRIKMAGLDPGKLYRITELDRLDDNLLPFEGQAFSGSYLMNVGLDIPENLANIKAQNAFSSRVLKLIAE